MFRVTNLPSENAIYIRVPQTKSKRASLARELGVPTKNLGLVSDRIKVTSEDPLALDDLCGALDHLRIHYVDARPSK